MANKNGIITRKDIIEDEALKWGEVYAENIKEAVKQNKVLVDSVKELNKQVQAFKVANSQKDYITAKQAEALATQQAIDAIKKQELAELSADKVKRSAIATLEVERKAKQAVIDAENRLERAKQTSVRTGIAEKLGLQETRRELTLQAKASGILTSNYDKLNAQRTIAQKRLGDLLSAERLNNEEIRKAQLEFNKLDVRVKSVDAALNNYSKNIGNYGSAFEGLNGTLRELLSTFGLVGGLALFGTVVKDIYSVITQFDRQLIAVGKTTNITGDDLKNFGREVVALGSNLDGISVQGLLESAEVAGTLGVKGTENILKFSTAIEKLKLTSDIVSEEQVQNFAKFIEVSSDSFENADKLASVITQLGNNFATTEAQILSNSTEIQKGLSVYDANAESVLALGAATSALGNEAEVSASSILKGFKVIDDAVTSGKNLEKVLKLTNLTQKELSDQFRKDSAGTFVKLVEGLSNAKKEGENLSSILGDLGLDEVRAFKTIGSLAINYGVLESAMASAKQEYIDNIALNKEVEAASQSIVSIVGDIKDKYDAYVLSANDASGGTQKLATALKFVRDNLPAIIDGFIKFGSILITYLAVQKAVTFATGVYTALKVAGTAAQISFTTATGIGTVAMKAQALAAQEAAASQTALNVATKVTPWGIILAAVAAVVVAYIAFNDELSESEKRIENIKKITADYGESEKYYSGESDKYREKRFSQIEKEIALRRAQGESSEKLDIAEIESKKSLVKVEIENLNNLKNAELERTKSDIDNSKSRIAQAQAEKAALIKANFRRNTNGDTVEDLDSAISKEKEKLDRSRTINQEASKSKISELNKLNGILSDLDKNKDIKDAEQQTEQTKKQLAAAKKAEADRIKLLKDRYDAEKKLNDDNFKLRQFRLQVAIDLENEIANNEKKSFDERLEALLSYNQIREAKTKEAAEFELQQLGKYNEKTGKFIRQLSDAEINLFLETGKVKGKITDEQRLIYEKYQNELTISAIKGEDQRKKLIDGEVDAIQKLTDATLQLQTNNQNKDVVSENSRYTDELQLAQGNFGAIEKAKEEHEKRIFEITKKYALEGLNLQIKTFEAKLAENDSLEQSSQVSAEKRAQIVADLERFKREASDLTTDAYVSDLTTKEEKEREFAEKIVDISLQLKDALVDFTNAIFDSKIQRIDDEIARSDEYYAAEIEKAGDDQRKKDALAVEAEKKRQELEKKKRKEQYKQAVFNKAMKIVDIGIATALAIMQSYAQLGPVAGNAGAILVSVLGAIQTATVLATPLPKYKMGRKGGPAEFAEVGDGFVNEIIEKKDGRAYMTPNVPTVTYLEKGDKVHSSVDEYLRLQKASMLASISMQGKKVSDFQASQIFDKNSDALLKEMQEVNKNLKKQKNKTIINLPKVDFPHEIWKMNNKNWN